MCKIHKVHHDFINCFIHFMDVESRDIESEGRTIWLKSQTTDVNKILTAIREVYLYRLSHAAINKIICFYSQ